MMLLWLVQEFGNGWWQCGVIDVVVQFCIGLVVGYFQFFLVVLCFCGMMFGDFYVVVMLYQEFVEFFFQGQEDCQVFVEFGYQVFDDFFDFGYQYVFGLVFVGVVFVGFGQ